MINYHVILCQWKALEGHCWRKKPLFLVSMYFVMSSLISLMWCVQKNPVLLCPICLSWALSSGVSLEPWPQASDKLIVVFSKRSHVLLSFMLLCCLSGIPMHEVFLGACLLALTIASQKNPGADCSSFLLASACLHLTGALTPVTIEQLGPRQSYNFFAFTECLHLPHTSIKFESHPRGQALSKFVHP